MKAWMLDEPGTPLALRRNAVAVRMEAVPLLSYTRAHVEGKLPYAYPPGPFSPGTNGVGRVEAVGEGVMSFRVDQRVAVNPYWIANETVREPTQVLIALTGLGADSGPMLAEYPWHLARSSGIPGIDADSARWTRRPPGRAPRDTRQVRGAVRRFAARTAGGR